MTETEKKVEIQKIKQVIDGLRQTFISQLELVDARLENLLGEDPESCRQPETNWDDWKTS